MDAIMYLIDMFKELFGRVSGSFQAFIDSFVKDFNQNLIVGNRYTFILDGLGQTLIIASCAALIGILLGCIVALMRLSKVKLLRGISSVYVDVIRGTPVAVQLMIMYFIIMVNYTGSKTVVAIISFGINSGAYVSEMVRSGILAIDKGQTEAGRSLGLSSPSTLFLIVMPQAFKIIIPTWFNEFIMLLKETSVVGFIGLMDLTKAGDYIKSLTFSPFFPLLTVAAIYFVIVSLLTRVFGLIERRMRQSDQR